MVADAEQFDSAGQKGGGQTGMSGVMAKTTRLLRLLAMVAALIGTVIIWRELQPLLSTAMAW